MFVQLFFYLLWWYCILFCILYLPDLQESDVEGKELSQPVFEDTEILLSKFYFYLIEICMTVI